MARFKSAINVPKLSDIFSITLTSRRSYPQSNENFEFGIAENEVAGWDKSIGTIATKLSTTLAFSGVMLKFVYDIDSDGYGFTLKALMSFTLLFSIGCCASGIRAKERGKAILSRVMLEDRYLLLSEKDLKTTIIRQWHAHIEAMKEVAQERASYLNRAIAGLVLCGVMFVIENIVSSIK
jgi:hypothetical protein